MTNLLKKNFALLLAAVLCLSLAACGGKDNAPETPENIVLVDSIDYNIEDTYDEYLGEWYLEDNGSLWVSENNGTYFCELYDAYNEVIGNDWRVTGVVRDCGTITRGGEDTVVLVCVHASDANFYYDTEDQMIFDFVDDPITLESDAWEAFQSIDFADLNGDGNSDVTMHFNDGGKACITTQMSRRMGRPLW